MDACGQGVIGRKQNNIIMVGRAVGKEKSNNKGTKEVKEKGKREGCSEGAKKIDMELNPQHRTTLYSPCTHVGLPSSLTRG